MSKANQSGEGGHTPGPWLCTLCDLPAGVCECDNERLPMRFTQRRSVEAILADIVGKAAGRAGYSSIITVDGGLIQEAHVALKALAK